MDDECIKDEWMNVLTVEVAVEPQVREQSASLPEVRQSGFWVTVPTLGDMTISSI